jgi:hypothetical protein
MFNAANAQTIATSAHNCITEAFVKQLLSTTNGATLASVILCTDVATAAAHKSVTIKKVSKTNVMLYGNVTNTNVYADAVKRSANKITTNDSTNVDAFVAQTTYYEHDDVCYSIAKHKTNGTVYLYSVVNNNADADAYYFINNVLASKQEVAQYLTASNAKVLLEGRSNVNVTFNIEHNVKPFVVKLANVMQINAVKQSITV